MKLTSLTPLLLILVTLAEFSKGQGNVCLNCDFPSSEYAIRQPRNTLSNEYFVIGGLFDVRPSDGLSCGKNESLNGLLQVEAFMFALRYYEKSIIRNRVSVAGVAFDSCMKSEQTIGNLLSYSQCRFQVPQIDVNNLVAYIGPYSRMNIVQISKLAKTLRKPLISPMAVVNKMDFDSELLFRTSPSLSHEMQEILNFLKSVNSDLVMVVYSEDDFWTETYNLLVEKAKLSDICTSFTEKVTRNTSFSQLANKLKDRDSAKYILPLMSRDQTIIFAKAISDLEQSSNFVLIFNSLIGIDKDLLQSISVIADNAVIFERRVPDSASVAVQEFMTHLKDLQSLHKNDSQVVNPWMGAYLAKNGAFPTDNEIKQMEQFFARTIVGVQLVVNGLDKAISQSCDTGSNNYKVCDTIRSVGAKDDTLLNSIKSDVWDQYGEPMLNSLKEYNLKTYDIRNKNITELNLNTLSAAKRAIFSSPTCPQVDTCCPAPTTTPDPTTTNAPARSTEKKEDDSDLAMVMYPRGQIITGAYSNADRDSDSYGIRFDLNHKWIIALGVFAGLGILCVVVFEIYILYKLLGTRLGNKWRTMWLGQLLLLGIFLCYLVLFTYLFIPTDATCGIIRFGVGVSYSICFAVLLVKLMVILTSKTSSEMLLASDGDSGTYLRGIYQFLMFVFAVGVQVVIDVQWLITVPPEAVNVTSNNGESVWICNHYTWEAGEDMYDMSSFVRNNFENHLMSLIYIMVMILITTILSLNAHGIITNHRESVFIGIAAGFSIPIWLAWGLVGGLNKDHNYAQEFGDACIAFGLLLTATLILFAMFLPKVRQLVNMGVEGIYLEDDRDTYYGGSVIMAPSSYKSKGPGSVVFVNGQQGIYSEPVVISTDDPPTHLRHTGYSNSVYSAPPGFLKKDSVYGGGRVLKYTDDLRGKPYVKRPQSEAGYGVKTPSQKGTSRHSSSGSTLGAL